MQSNKGKIENEFGKLFYSFNYINFKNYLFNYRFRKIMIRKFFNKYLSLIKGKDSISLADIGSGISPVSPLPKETTFIELEKEAVDYLNKNGFKAIKGDITNLPIKSHSFDFIFCSEVLEHVKDYKKALNEMRRISNKGGIAIITVPIHKSYWKSDDDFVGHQRRFNPEELQDNLREAGFSILERVPIGSGLERWLTYYTVKIARKVGSQNLKAGKIKSFIFYVINTILLGVVFLSYLINNEKNSSIILFVARKS